MKTLFTDFSLGWDINSEKLENLKKDLQEAGETEIKFFKSKFSPLSFSIDKLIISSEPAEAINSNHVEIRMGNTVIAKFFRRKLGFAGILFDENLSEYEKGRIVDIFSTHGYFTNKTVWKHASHMPLICLIFIGSYFLIASVYAYEIFFQSSTLHEIPPEFFEVLPIKTVRISPGRVVYLSDVLFFVANICLGLAWLFLYLRFFKWSKFDSKKKK